MIGGDDLPLDGLQPRSIGWFTCGACDLTFPGLANRELNKGMRLFLPDGHLQPKPTAKAAPLKMHHLALICAYLQQRLRNSG